MEEMTAVGDINTHTVLIRQFPDDLHIFVSDLLVDVSSEQHQDPWM